MKRRSARPFMVEVKHARTSRAAMTAAEPQKRPGKALWPELVQAEAKPVPPAIATPPAPQPEPREPDAPVRRVLPSLVPMFQGADEPETDLQPEAAAKPSSRPRRPRREKVRAVAQPVQETQVAEPVREIRHEPIAADPAGHGQDPAPRPAPWRRTKELRLGERWKRRLPPYCR